jgi:hypothetical protein
MRNKWMIPTVLAALLAGAGVQLLQGQVRDPSGGEGRLYPKSATSDGYLICAPHCSLLGPCC